MPATSPLCTRGTACGDGLGVCTVPLRCLRGDRCTAAVRLGTDKRHITVGAPADRALCPTCERAVADVLRQVPQLYVDLEQAMPNRVTVNGGGKTTARTGSPLLTNGRALHLQETVHQLLTAWEDIVRDTAGLSMVLRRDQDPWERSFRRPVAGRETQRAAELLGFYLTAWLVHAPVEYAITATTADPDDPRAEPTDEPQYVVQAGWQAASALLDWRGRGRSALGQTRAVVQRDEPCMWCEVRAVTETAGDDVVRCENCQHTWTRDQYAALVRGFEPYLRKLAKTTKGTPKP
ncbi:MAG: hypothetical protein HOV66_27860 [Streptomycetaceae bacterium]|nr:hypothetical protein [Streptomycetaceae bacterium]